MLGSDAKQSGTTFSKSQEHVQTKQTLTILSSKTMNHAVCLNGMLLQPQQEVKSHPFPKHAISTIGRCVILLQYAQIAHSTPKQETCVHRVERARNGRASYCQAGPRLRIAGAVLSADIYVWYVGQ